MLERACSVILERFKERFLACWTRFFVWVEAHGGFGFCFVVTFSARAKLFRRMFLSEFHA